MPDNFREPTRTMGPRSPGSDHSHPLSLVVKSGDESNTFVHKKKTVETRLVSSRLSQVSSVPTSISGGTSDTTSGFVSDASSAENRTSPVSICISANPQVYKDESEQPQDFSVERFIEDSTSNITTIRSSSLEEINHENDNRWMHRKQNVENKQVAEDTLPLPLVVSRKSFNDVVETNDQSNSTYSKNNSGYSFLHEDSGNDGEIEDNLDTSGGSSPVLQPGRYSSNTHPIQKKDIVCASAQITYHKSKELVIPDVVLERKVNQINTEVSTNITHESSERSKITPNVTIEKVVYRENDSQNIKMNSGDEEATSSANSARLEQSKRTGEVKLGIKVKEFARFDAEVVDAAEMERQLIGPNNKYEQTLAALTGMSKRTISVSSVTEKREGMETDMRIRPRGVDLDMTRKSMMLNSNKNITDVRYKPVEEDFDIRSEVSSIDTWMSGTSYHSYITGASNHYHEDSVKNQMSQGNYACTFCDKIFTNTYHLNSHLVTHTGERSFGCPQCDKSFGRRSTLRAHMTTHSKTSNFMCPVCEKACNDNNSLEEHIRMHTGEKPFICTVCNKAYARKSHLSVHYRVHTGERPFVCVDCGKDFTEKRFLNDHMQTSHSGGAGGNDSGPLKCPNCHREFAYKTSLKQHLKKQMCVRNLARGSGSISFQGNHSKQFACPFCDKSYSWKQTLKQHVSMYHRNKVHTDEFWKYEMAKHRRTVVDDKDRNDDMWQQQLGRYGKDDLIKLSSPHDHMYGGEHNQHGNNSDPSHDERWLQQIKRATSKDSRDTPQHQPLTDAKLLALQSLQSSLHSINHSIVTDESEKDDRDSSMNFFCQQKFPSQQINRMDIKEEVMDENLARPCTPLPKQLKDKISVENGHSDASPRLQDDTYLTLLAHLSAQRKACEEDTLLSTSTLTREGYTLCTEREGSIISREKSSNQYHQPSQISESLYSQQQKQQGLDNSTPSSIVQDVTQDQRHSSKSPPTLSLPDIKEECSVSRTKMWLAQLGQYRQKAVQDEMEKSHDELWEEQISRIKSNPVKSPIEPLEITIEDESNIFKAHGANKNIPNFSQKAMDPPKLNMDESSLSTDNSSCSISTPPLFVSKKGKTVPLISALQVQQAPTRTFKMISNTNVPRNTYDVLQKPLNTLCDNVPLKSYTKGSLDLIRSNEHSPTASPRSYADKISPPPAPISPIATKGQLKEHIAFKHLLSINPSTIVNINGQNVNMRSSRETNYQEKSGKSLSSLMYNERLSLSTPIESNNNGPSLQPVVEEQPNREETVTQARHIPLAIPPLQPTSHLPPVAKYKHEKSNKGNPLSKENYSKETSILNKDDNSKGIKPKYPPPDPSTFGSSSVLKMLLLDPSKRKRPASPLPNPIQNKRSTYSSSNISTDLQHIASNSEKKNQNPNMFNRFSGAPNTSDETDILRQRLLGIKNVPTPPSTPSKSVHMLLPKPRYSPPSATITSADIVQKQRNTLQRQSPIAVEEFTKVAAAAATLASFTMSHVEDKQINQQNVERVKITKKVNFPIEVNYEHYYQDNSKYVLKSHTQQLLPTQQHLEPMLFEYDDLKNGKKDTGCPEKDIPMSNQTDQLNHQRVQKYCGNTQVKTEQNNNNNNNDRSPHRQSQEFDSTYSKELENQNEQCVANMSAYSKTSVSKQLLYRYTTNNNNNNNTISRTRQHLEDERNAVNLQHHRNIYNSTN